MASPFDYVKTIRQTKEDIMVDVSSEKDYVPFVVNRALSMSMDTIMHSNEMNRFHHLPKKLQYQFLLNSVKASKGYVPWIKAEKVEDLGVIKEFYDVSNSKAMELLKILTDDQIKLIRSKLQKGGKL